MRVRLLLYIASFFLVSLTFVDVLSALPRMSLMSGAPCATCHVNVQGGDMRSEIGWGSMAFTGLWDYEELGVDWLAEMYSNEVIAERVSVGMDIRIQMARFGRPQLELGEDGETSIFTPARRIIPMQIQPHMLVEVTDYLKLHGSYAVGQGTFRGNLCDTPFAGQSCYTAQAIIDPSPHWPTLRAGMFQPSIGIRHDDHTMLIRHDASRDRGVLIPANYAELGVEASYQPKYWMRVEAGGFRAANLSESIGNNNVVSQNDVAYLGRLSWLPHFQLGESSYFGTVGFSGFGAGKFHMQNIFAGLGLLDRAALMVEAARFTEGGADAKVGLNLSTMLSVQLWEWLIVEGRLEQAQTTVGEQDFETRAAVLGVQFFPIPYVKLRPEYRYIQTNAYAMGQYTAQLHLFF